MATLPKPFPTDGYLIAVGEEFYDNVSERVPVFRRGKKVN